MDWWWIGGVIVVVGAGLIIGLRPRWRAKGLLREFRRARPELEAAFLEAARGSGKPKGLFWKDIRFDEAVTLLRDRQSGEWTALVGVSVGFEAEPGGGMEEVEAVKERRDATALFHRSTRAWGTAGKVLFNLGPAQAATRLGRQFEPVAIDHGNE
jgi:hypothetical protein